jgi:phosphatidylglycerol:prolipoprotein diacylglycerol transferase
MIDPVIFSVDLFGITIALRWYGLLIMSGVFVGAFITWLGVKWRGGDPEIVWNGLVWVIVPAIIGARLWFAVNDTLGGSTRYLEDPVRILGFGEGGLRGLHIYGGLLFGGIAAFLWARHYRVDVWMILDSVGPGLLIGQALARPANFINQELYGPPTELPWGISIDAGHRLPPWNDLSRYPEETTRFHPTFAYEIAWNLLAGGFLLWLGRRHGDKLRPGAAFALWLILAGLGRFIVEWFRPDQPRLPGTDISFTRIVASLMVVVGAVFLLIKYEVIRLPFLSPGTMSYQIPQGQSNEPSAQIPEE